MRIMHKKICGVLLLLLMSCGASAQDIEIRDFKENIRDLRASLNPVSDLSGEFCALIRFSVSDTTFVIEPNMGFIKRTTGPGEILLYVPTMARKLTIKHEGLLPLRGYKIPVKLEPKRVYDATIVAIGIPHALPKMEEKGSVETPPLPKDTVLVKKTPVPSSVSPVNEKKQKANDAETHMYAGIGLEAFSMTGVTGRAGMEVGSHIIEIGGVIGFGKTDILYFYDSQGNLIAGRSYHPMRVQLQYGYGVKLAEMIFFAPMIGLGLNAFQGTDEKTNPDYPDYYKAASSFSIAPAVRLSALVGRNIKLHVTPAYSIGMYKSNNCKLISENDSKFKSWTDGLHLELGVNILF